MTVNPELFLNPIYDWIDQLEMSFEFYWSFAKHKDIKVINFMVEIVQ